MDLIRYLTLRRIGKAIYGLVVALLLGEIGLGVFYTQEEALQRDLIQRDPKVGFRLVPGYDGKLGKTSIPLRVNSLGFRDIERGLPVPGGLRVLVLGDSMVFGQGLPVEETFPRYLEPMLSERLGVAVEVINGGVPGFGTTQEVALFEEMADRVQPDLVLLGIAVFNDVTDNLKFSEQLHRWQEQRSVARRWRAFLRHNSQLYMMLRRYRAGVSGAQMMEIHSKTPSERTQRGLGLIEDGVRRLQLLTAERGIAFAVVINPAHKQSSAAVWEETISKYQLDPSQFSYDQPNQRLHEFLTSQRIPVVDLLPVFRSRPQENFYFTEHWQAPGHELVARELSEFLDKEGLLRKALSRRASVPRDG